MIPLGPTRYIHFRVTDDSDEPIEGLTMSDFTTVFLRNNEACSDELVFTSNGQGRYVIAHTATQAGTHYLELFHPQSDVRVISIEDVVSSEAFEGSAAFVTLDHNYGGAGALSVLVDNPGESTVAVFDSAGWDQNQQDQTQAVGTSAVLEDGSWASPILVMPGTYHVVVFGFRATTVLKAGLVIPA